MSPPTTYTQTPLIEAAARERARRAARRASLSPGQLVLLTAAAAARLGAAPGERLAFVEGGSGATRRVETTHERKIGDVSASDLAACAQPGDVLSSGAQVIFFDGGSVEAEPRVFAVGMTAADGDMPIGAFHSPTAAPSSTWTPASKWDTIAPSVVDLGSETCAIRGVGADGTVGPGLLARDAAAAVRPLEPGVVRRSVRSAKVDGREAALVDFLGGATLWVWRDLLRPSYTLGLPGSQLCDARGDYISDSAIDALRPDKPAPTPAAPAPITASGQAAALSSRAARAAALPSTTSAPSAPALPEGTTAMTSTPALSAPAQICLAVRSADFQPGAIVRVGDSYDEALPSIMEDFKRELGGCRQISLAGDLLAEADEVMPGLYQVVEVRELRYKNGTAAVLVLHKDEGGDDSDELHVLAGLVELVAGGGALVAAGGGALVEASKGGRGLVAAAADGAKGLARRGGQIAMAEGKRKALLAAEELGGDTVLEVHNTIKDGVGGLLRMFGLERFEGAAKLGIDLAATSGARMLGEAIAESNPGVAGTLQTVSTIIERKQAQRTAADVRAAIAPLTGAVRSSFGEAVGRALAPALNTVGALPAPAEEPAAEPEVVEVAPKARKSGSAKPRAAGGRKAKDAPTPKAPEVVEVEEVDAAE